MTPPTTAPTRSASELDDDILSSRELQVVEHASHGKTNQQIANALGVEVETVKSHIKNALKKSGASNRAHIVAQCLRRGAIR